MLLYIMVRIKQKLVSGLVQEYEHSERGAVVHMESRTMPIFSAAASPLLSAEQNICLKKCGSSATGDVTLSQSLQHWSLDFCPGLIKQHLFSNQHYIKNTERIPLTSEVTAVS